MVKVTVCAVLVLPTCTFPNAVVADKAVAAGLTAVPDNDTVPKPVALRNAFLAVPLAAAVPVGVSLTLRMQLAPFTTVLPQFCVTEYIAGAPVLVQEPDAVVQNVGAVKGRFALVVLVTVTSCAALAESN